MRIPGYTAEASLRDKRQDFLMTTAPRNAGGVVPQFCMSNEAGVVTCCQCYYGSCSCTRLGPRVFE
jgi:hypothetical protein